VGDYQKPKGPRIGRNANTDRLYRLEDEMYTAFQASSTELANVLKHSPGQYYTHTLPEAIFSFLEHYDDQAVRLAVELWLERHQHIED
jgi:hypothetical protein